MPLLPPLQTLLDRGAHWCQHQFSPKAECRQLGREHFGYFAFLCSSWCQLALHCALSIPFCLPLGFRIAPILHTKSLPKSLSNRVSILIGCILQFHSKITIFKSTPDQPDPHSDSVAPSRNCIFSFSSHLVVRALSFTILSQF